MEDRSTTGRPVMHRRHWERSHGAFLLLMGCLLTAAGCGGSGASLSPTSPLVPGTPAAPTLARILFVSDRDGRPQIYTMAPDGTGARRWSASSANDVSPAWSPDHARVAFVSDRDHVSHIFVVDSEGRRARDLTAGSAVCGAPSWSPDGARLAYVQWEPTGAQANIRVMKADGSDARALTANAGINGGPAWAKSGRIYFTTNRERGGTSFDLYVMDASGSGQRKVAAIPALVGRPALSPNGQRLAYAALVAPQTPGLFVMDAGTPRSEGDGAGGGRAIGPVNSAEPAWSPDGRRLLFTSWQDGNAEIYSMDTSGGNIKRLTANDAADGGAAY